MRPGAIAWWLFQQEIATLNFSLNGAQLKEKRLRCALDQYTDSRHQKSHDCFPEFSEASWGEGSRAGNHASVPKGQLSHRVTWIFNFSNTTWPETLGRRILLSVEFSERKWFFGTAAARHDNERAEILMERGKARDHTR
jgi:hypothetical protein